MFQLEPKNTTARLATWAVELDDLDHWLLNGGKAKALELPPHRVAYLDYEGEVSGNRGVVRRVHRGTLIVMENQLQRKRFELTSSSINGTLTLDRKQNIAADLDEPWWEMEWRP